MVRELIGAIISQEVEQTVPMTIRETVNAVAKICNDPDQPAKREKDDTGGTTVLQVAEVLQLDRSAASRRLKQALRGGYLKNLETKRGQPYRLVLGDPLPEKQQVLPTPEDVKKKWRNQMK